MRTMPEALGSSWIFTLEDTIHLELLPALTGQNQLGDVIRNLLALPARVGGLGLITPVQEAVSQFRTSIVVTTPLVKQILNQSKYILPLANSEGAPGNQK